MTHKNLFRKPLGIPHRHALAQAALWALVLAAPSAQALKIDLGNDDVKARWDTTVGYSLGVRTQRPSAELSDGFGSLNFNDGDLNFSRRRRPITNRLDVFSEADVTYRGVGARLSAAGWYDAAYQHGTSNSSDLAPFPPPSPYDPRFSLNSGAPGQFTAATRELHGQKAELLDAFVFGRFDLGGKELNVRLGRHALLWGESLFFGFNALAAGMAPIDLLKAQSSPNAQLKEIIRPVGQLSGQLQLSNDVSVSAFVPYEWDKSRLPAAGSFFSANDTFDEGGERLYMPFGPGGTLVPAQRGADVEAPNSGQGGVQMHVRLPQWDVDLGFYALRYHAKMPVAYLAVSPDPTVLPSYFLVYPENIKTLGTSLNTTLGEFNVGSELSIRTNAPLARGLVILPGAGPFDARDNPAYPVGRTLHLNLSTLYSVPSNVIANEASLVAEVAWSRVLSCTLNCANLPPSAQQPGGFAPRDTNAERDAWGFRAVYTPVYRQVVQGVDLSVPLGLGYSPKGKAEALGPAMVDKGGDLSLGLSANVRETYTVAVNYTHFFGTALPPIDAAGNFTFAQSLKDRDNITVSARFSF